MSRVDLWTKIQWGAIGAVGLTLCGFVLWALTTLASINTAMAQEQATTHANDRDLQLHLVKDNADKVVIFNMFEEQRKDSKALYEAVMSRKRQARLESRDGGE